MQQTLASFVFRGLVSCSLILSLIACQMESAPAPDAQPTPRLTPLSAPSATTALPTPLRTPLPTLLPGQPTPPLYIELTLWLSDEFAYTPVTPGGAAFGAQISSFQSTYTNVRLSVQTKKSSGKGGLTDLLLTTQSALPQAMPDLVALDLRDLPLVAKEIGLQPLSAEFAQGLQADLFPFALQAGQVDGQLYAIAFTADVLHALHNTSASSASIAVATATFTPSATPTATLPVSASPSLSATTTITVSPTPTGTTPVPLTPTPTATATLPLTLLTWNALVSNNTKYAFALNNERGQVSDSLLAQYVALGGRFGDARGRPSLDREPLRETLEFYRNGISQGFFAANPASVKTADDVWRLYQSGRATLIDTSARRYLQEREQLRNSNFAAIPTRSGNLATISQSWGYVIMTKEPMRRRAAERFIEWMLATEQTAGWNRAALRVPTRRSALNLWANDNAYRDFMQRLLTAAINRPMPIHTLNEDVLDSALQTAFNDVLNNNLSPAEAANKAIAAVNRP